MAGSPSRSIPRSSAAPARKGKPSAASRRAAKPSLLGRVIARPGVIVAGATFAAVMTGIIVNAVLFQKGHHPSPLFGQAQTQAVGAEPARLAPPPVPLPVPRQALETPDATPAEAEAPPPAAPAPLPLHPAHAVSKVAKHIVVPAAHKTVSAPQVHTDLIGQLIGKTHTKND